MIEELFISQEEDDTTDGLNSTRLFVSTWADWNAGFGTFNDPVAGVTPNWFFPIVGDEWPNRPLLSVSHRRSETIDNDNVRITIVYSTEGRLRKNRANEVGSWREALSVSFEESSAAVWPVRDVYTTSGALQIDSSGDPVRIADSTIGAGGLPREQLLDWETKWNDAAPAKAKQMADAKNHLGDPLYGEKTVPQLEATLKKNRPDAIIRLPRATHRFTAYSSKALYQTVIPHIGKINLVDFLVAISDEKGRVDPRYDDDILGMNDAGRWLFAGVDAEWVEKNVWRIDFTFLYDESGWNVQEGIATQMYTRYDFRKFIATMKKSTDDILGKSTR